jgi:alanine racemase
MRAHVEVDLSAIAHNIELAKSQTSSQVLAVVKADAYGHGLIHVANAALKAGASWLGTALLEESIALRKSGITAPIIAWLTPSGEDFKSALSLNIDLSISSIALAQEILGVAKEIGAKPRLHIEVDTGMHRGGVLDEFDQLVRYLAEHRDEFTLVGYWSHFARADEPWHEYNQSQLDSFTLFLDRLRAEGFDPEIIHFANSAAALSFAQSHHSMVRVGIAMYGLSPDVAAMGSSSHLGLRPAMTVKAKLHLVKKIAKGDAVGYGGVGVATQDTTIGVVTMGYADGIPRIADSRAGVSCAGRKAPLLGRVSMDQFVVDLGPDSKARSGNEVVVFGPESASGACYTADDWAAASGTINYEIVTRIASRVARIYS